MHAAEDDLQRCRRELLRLQNENAALRYAATTFGDLAERLNAIVDRHRRLGPLHAGSQRAADDDAPTIAPENPGGA
jgi:hypothetical protein